MTDKTSSGNVSTTMLKVFSKASLSAMSPQQRGALNRMIQQDVDEHGPQAITEGRMRGYKEMLDEHLYFPPTAPWESSKE